jgi:hypothetical protein
MNHPTVPFAFTPLSNYFLSVNFNLFSVIFRERQNPAGQEHQDFEENPRETGEK